MDKDSRNKKNKLTYNRLLLRLVRLLEFAFLPLTRFEFVNDRIREMFTPLHESYNAWILIDSLLIFVGIILLGRSLRIHRKFAFKRSHRAETFKSDAIAEGIKVSLNWVLLVVITLGAPGAYYCYNTELRYTWRQFDDSQIGILIANFRQVPLDDLIPYRKYSTWLEEDLPKLVGECEAPVEFAFARTPAFVTSDDEARAIGKKNNATIIMWGEIFRGGTVVSIRPKMIVRFLVNIDFGNKFGWEFDLRSSESEDWKLDRSVMTLDTISILLQDMLVLPIFAKLSAKSESREELIRFFTCSLERYSFLPAAIQAVMSMRIGNHYYHANEYDSANSWYYNARRLTDSWDDNFGAKAEFSAVLALNLAKSYANIEEPDSALHFVFQACAYDLLVVIKDSEIYQSFWHSLTHAPRRTKTDWLHDALLYWERNPDSLIGNFIHRLCDQLREEPPKSFNQKYDSLYPKYR